MVTSREESGVLSMILDEEPHWPRWPSEILTDTRQGLKHLLLPKACIPASLCTVARKLLYKLGTSYQLVQCLREQLFAAWRKRLVIVAELHVPPEIMLQ